VAGGERGIREWAKAGMLDCINQIEKLAEEAE
jgi:hypothetical protein